MEFFTVEDYVLDIQKLFNLMNKNEIYESIRLVQNTIIENKKIITCGNGGSASTASHYITDWNKCIIHRKKI